MTGAFLEEYTAGGVHWNNGPPSAEVAGAERDRRYGACQNSGVAHWHGNVFGKAPCCHCQENGAGAPRCRVTAMSHSSHGPQWDTRWQGGPDCDVGHFPLGCTVVCKRPKFTLKIYLRDNPSREGWALPETGGPLASKVNGPSRNSVQFGQNDRPMNKDSVLK